MKKFISFFVVLLFSAALCGCDNDSGSTISDAENRDSSAAISSENPGVANSKDDPTDSIPSFSTSDKGESIIEDNGGASILTIPEELTEIPRDYYSPAKRQGTLVELNYNTYESFSYDEQSQQLEKRAIVYLPNDYDENKRYNIFYLMHGGWGNETTTLGTPDNPSYFKNVIDNAIGNGEIEPLIIVCPTYNNTSREDSASFSLALQLNRNYYHELLNDLIPAVESKYSGYAEGVSTEELIAARDHRAFGGFSMGSVATWRTFQNALDYFRYFFPMSCGTTLDDDEIFAAANGHDKNDYFVWIMTGTADFAYSYVNNRVDKMRNSEYFLEADNEQDGNFAYRIKEGYDHGGVSSMEYTFNALRQLWK